MSIRRKNILVSSAGLILLGLICILSSVWSFKGQAKEEIRVVTENLLREKRAKLQEITDAASSIITTAYNDANSQEKIIALYQSDLRNIVNAAMDVVESIDRNRSLSEAEQKRMALQAIKNLRYNQNDYIWINDSRPFMIMHPMKPALDGTDLSNFADPNGKKLFVEFSKVCAASGEGFVNYMWPKPGEDEPVEKISYAKLYEPWDWILGTGVYLESSETEIMNRARDAISELRYGDDQKGYFWIHNMDVEMVMHPIKPELDGTDISTTKDPNGKALFVEMMEVCRDSGAGFVEYMWPKPGFDQPVKKLSYVKLHPETGWILGTGIYLDDVDAIVEGVKKQVNSSIRNQTISLILLVMVITGIMIAVVSYISNRISKPIVYASKLLGEIATGEGDLTARMRIDTKDEVGQLASNFNEFVKKLQAIIKEVAENASQVHDSANRLNRTSSDLNTHSEGSHEKANNVSKSSNEVTMNMTSVASAMEEASTNMHVIATATEEMSATINEIVSSTDSARIKTEGAVEQARLMTDQIGELQEATRQISEFVGIITDISDQVNLLALNATIEAARAGEAGKGFAVVASEIKELAGQTSTASSQIQENINRIINSSDRTSDEIVKISEVVEDLSQIVMTIATALEEQSVATAEITNNVGQASEGIGEVNMNVAQTSELVQEVNTDVDEVSKNSREILKQSDDVKDMSKRLNRLSEQLDDLVSKFKF